MIVYNSDSFSGHIGSVKLYDIVKDKKYIMEGTFKDLKDVPDAISMLEQIENNNVIHYCLEKRDEILIVESQDKSMVVDLDVHKSGKISISVYGDTKDIVQGFMDKFIEYIKKYEYKEQRDEKVRVGFSFVGSNGRPQIMNRSIFCPNWNDIKNNYIYGEKIEELFQKANPYKHGKLIFWHGIPGTGKTYCIRSLLQQWKKKATYTFIIDTEQFLNNPSYMLTRILESDSGLVNYDEDEFPTIPYETDDADDGEKFKVFIMEDSLDFVLEENRSSIGPAMSRLLNVTEGFIGQGLRVIFLITTNAPVGKIDDAFIRPGRCIQSLSFPSFNQQKAKEWLDKNNKQLDLTTKRDWTLAELYAGTGSDSVDLLSPSEEIGFAK